LVAGVRGPRDLAPLRREAVICFSELIAVLVWGLGVEKPEVGWMRGEAWGFVLSGLEECGFIFLEREWRDRRSRLVRSQFV
jgi:hypothetical protein